MSLVASAATLAVLASFVAPQERGVTSDKILLGQSCALQGPAAGLGKGMQAGLETYFAGVNANGGIGGRKIELKTLNDGYEPDKCELVTRTLIEKVGVFGMIGGVGTPTSLVAVPVCEENKTPYVAPFTGAEFLRNPWKRYVVNYRGSYYQEMERLAQYLVDEQGLQKIACFYQNDGYGQAGLSGIEIALEKRGLELVSTGTYERNTVAVASGIGEVAAGEPDAVIMVGAYKPCASAIKIGKQKNGLKNALFCNISFVGTNNLLSELDEFAEGCIVSQVVPFPFDTSVPVVAEYQAAMKAAGRESDIGFISLEGYLSAKMFCHIAGEVQGDFTRESFLDAVAATGAIDLGGVSLVFGEGDHQGMDQVWLTEFRGGRVVPLEGRDG